MPKKKKTFSVYNINNSKKRRTEESWNPLAGVEPYGFGPLLKINNPLWIDEIPSGLFAVPDDKFSEGFVLSASTTWQEEKSESRAVRKKKSALEKALEQGLNKKSKFLLQYALGDKPDEDGRNIFHFAFARTKKNSWRTNIKVFIRILNYWWPQQPEHVLQLLRERAQCQAATAVGKTPFESFFHVLKKMENLQPEKLKETMVKTGQILCKYSGVNTIWQEAAAILPPHLIDNVKQVGTCVLPVKRLITRSLHAVNSYLTRLEYMPVEDIPVVEENFFSLKPVKSFYSSDSRLSLSDLTPSYLPPVKFSPIGISFSTPLTDADVQVSLSEQAESVAVQFNDVNHYGCRIADKNSEKTQNMAVASPIVQYKQTLPCAPSPLSCQEQQESISLLSPILAYPSFIGDLESEEESSEYMGLAC